MTLQEEMDSHTHWTQEEIDALKHKHRRTHFTHFRGLDRKLKKTKTDEYEWVEVSIGRWKRVKKDESYSDPD